MRTSYAGMLMVWAGLAGCGAESPRSTTGPDADPTESGGGPASTRFLVRANGDRISVSAGHVLGARGTTAAASRTALAVAPTVCDAGFIDPNGSPEGGLDGGTYASVEVPPGRICVLSGATVVNSVRALGGARLFIQGSDVGGNVRGMDAAAVQVLGGSQVHGNVNIQGGGDAMFASCAVDDAVIDGDLACTGNDPGAPIIRTEGGPVQVGGSIRLVDNVIPAGNVMLLLNATVAGNADVRHNTDGGFKQVMGNAVTGSLVCRKNDAPFTGGPNTAGAIRGQCF
jgi:hypothetical protein